MEVSMNSDFNSAGFKKITLNKRGLTEIEDGELIEDSNINIVTEEEKKKILRAKRFGPIENESKPQDPKVQRLYKRMKINKNTRLEALHLHGTDHMKTEDIFSLFSTHSPASIEWLTDKTCNAVWLDQEMCAKALLNCTVRIKGQNPEESDESEEEFINKEDIRCTLPPGGIWRRGPASPLAQNLLVRFATYSDKRRNKPVHSQHADPLGRNIVFLDEGDEVAKKFRPDSGNPWADIAKEWSYFEMRTAAKKQDERLPVRDARELLSKTTRIPAVAGGGGHQSSMDEDLLEDPRVVTSYSSLTGRKMQADIEEKKILSRKMNSRTSQIEQNVDLRQRLSRKRSAREDIYDEEFLNLTDDYDYLPHRRKKPDEDTWLRANSEDSEDEVNDHRYHHKTSTKDLRTKLGNKNKEYKKGIRGEEHSNSRTKHHHSVSSSKSSSTTKTTVVLTKNHKKFIPDCPLQIEIDNDIYFERRMNRNDDFDEDENEEEDDDTS
uniref:Nuclear cap-binding protein subunit 3 n=2 Tax=Rhodnius prolixus TaxID=13249 RepID=T1HDT8_RHOPR